MSAFIDLTGKRFGRWRVVAVGDLDKYKKLTWLCRCDCGTERTVAGDSLRKRESNSCGCLAREKLKRRSTTHGRYCTPEWNSWKTMKSRCLNPKNAAYFYYGARGIKVCERWRISFVNFFKDMGPKPGPKFSVERINNNGDYEPSNCKWATMEEQSNNKRSNTYLTFRGKTQTVSQWSKELGFTSSCVIFRRMRKKWTTEKILNTPLDRLQSERAKRKQYGPT